jgi:peptidoglycan-N-acetylglucosamine deacetylase
VIRTKRATWAACGGIAAGIVLASRAVDRRLTVPATLLAAGYLVGTFRAGSGIFGRPARTRTDDGAFALTFDDGPDPRHTPQISSLLAERGHRATFFVLGRQAERHPELVAKLVADGHEVGNHGLDHRLLALSPPSEIRAQIVATEAAVERATGQPPAPVFRAPHGARSPWLARTVGGLGYRLCAWDGHVFDTSEPGADAIAARVEGLLEPGRVVLLHDGDGSDRGRSREQTVQALERVLDAADERGLRSVPLSTLLD